MKLKRYFFLFALLVSGFFVGSLSYSAPDGEKEPIIYFYNPDNPPTPDNPDTQFPKASEAMISPTDLGILRGHAVVERVSFPDLNATDIGPHLNAFRENAKKHHLEKGIPLDDDQLKGVINELLSKNKYPYPILHLVITGGDSPDGKSITNPTFYISMEDPKSRAQNVRPTVNQENSANGPLCYFQGEFIPVAEARVSPFDEGILNQKAVFDFLTSYGNKPFHLQDHIKRLRESVRLKDLPPIQLSDEEIASIIRKLIDGNKIENPNIRIVYSAGVNFDPTFYILTEASHPYPKEIYEKGIKVILDEYQRPMPGAKHDYSNAIDNGEKQKSEGAFEILYTWEGNVLEATTSNVFIVKGGVLITPPEGRILPGLTRQIVLKLAREEGLAVNERDISLEELLHADEVFITGSTKKVVPVAKVGNATIGSGIVGKTTKKLMAVYQEYIDSGEWKEVAPKSLQHAIRTSMGRLIGTVGFPDFNNDKNAE